MTRTVLITGAGGFVGSHLAQGFLAMGDSVLALDAHVDAATRARLDGAELIEAPLAMGVLPAGRSLDLVIHGAAITTPPEDFGLSAEQHVDANLGLVRDALRLAMDHGARDFVFLSSSGVFAEGDGQGVQLESTPPTAAMPYADAKRAGEGETAAANSPTLRALSVRLGPIYGPHEASRRTRQIVSQVRRWLDRAVAGEPLLVTQPAEHRDWTFAPDLAGALVALLAIEPPLSGVVHLGSPTIIANLDLARRVARLVAGARVEVVASTAPPRLPMASDRIDLAALYPWTPLDAGLAATHDAMVSP